MAVQAASWNTTVPTAPVITVYAQSTAGGDIVLDSVLVKNSANNIVDQITFAAATAPSVGTSLTEVDISLSSGVTLGSGNVYSVTLVSKQGGTFVSPSFTMP